MREEDVRAILKNAQSRLPKERKHYNKTSVLVVSLVTILVIGLSFNFILKYFINVKENRQIELLNSAKQSFIKIISLGYSGNTNSCKFDFYLPNDTIQLEHMCSSFVCVGEMYVIKYKNDNPLDYIIFFELPIADSTREMSYTTAKVSYGIESSAYLKYTVQGVNYKRTQSISRLKNKPIDGGSYVFYYYVDNPKSGFAKFDTELSGS